MRICIFHGMNNERREKIKKAAGQLDDLKNELETLKDEEQEYYDNMPESLRGGEKGEAAQSAIDNLDSALSELDSAIQSVESVE